MAHIPLSVGTEPETVGVSSIPLMPSIGRRPGFQNKPNNGRKVGSRSSPVFYLETIHSLELFRVVRHESHIQTHRMRGNE